MPRLASFASLVGLLAAAACGGGGGGGHGTLALSMTDGPFPATEGCLSAALITIDEVTVQAGDGWATIPLIDDVDGVVDGQVTLDLLNLRSGLDESLAVGSLPTGRYGQIRLHIVEAELVFADASPNVTFKVPSGMQSGLKIDVPGGFLIAAGQTTPILLDFDLSQSFHVQGSGGSPTCDDLKTGGPGATTIFSPVIHAVNLDETGVVTGTVTDSTATPVADVEVSAFPSGTVVDASSVPTASTFTAPAGLLNAPEGSYAMHLDAGTYDLYLRPPGATDFTLGASGVVITTGNVTTQDLSLP
jgi:hypothetical protein